MGNFVLKFEHFTCGSYRLTPALSELDIVVINQCNERQKTAAPKNKNM